MRHSNTQKKTHTLSKLKLAQYQGFKHSAFLGVPQFNPPPSVPLINTDETQFLTFRNRIQDSTASDPLFKLYLRLSDTITDITQNQGALRRVREVEYQLLKIILVNSNLIKQNRVEKRQIMTRNGSKQNLDALVREANCQTSTVKRRKRKFQQSMVDCPSLAFERFKVDDSCRRLQLQIQRLPEKMSGQLGSHLDHVSIQKELTQCRNLGKHLSGELQLRSSRMMQLMREIGQLKMEIEELNREKNAVISENVFLKKRLAASSQGVQYQEMWKMASQEIGTLQILKSDLDRELRHLGRKYKISKDRLSCLNSRKGANILEENKQEMEDLKYVINELRFCSKTSPSEFQPEPKLLHKLPHVLVLFQSDKVKENDLNVHRNKILSTDFFLKLRGIMDSKYYEFWSTQDSKSCCSLADFTMGFLDKFTIDPRYKKVALNGSNVQITEKMKLEFVLDVSSPNVKDVIQICMFKEFLNEERSRDELFFYLSCRHVLLNGPALDNSICSQDPILFIPLDRAFKMVDQILINFDKNLIQKIKAALSLKRKKKAHKYFVDGHFLLRALLELYSLERKKKLTIFSKSLVNTDPGHKNITFKALKKFINKNYQFVTNAQISELYRGCWQLTGGKLDIHSLFEMCDWIFVQELKEQIFLPKRFDNQYREEMEEVETHLEEGKYFTRKIVELGGEKLLVKASRLKQLIGLRTRDSLNAESLFALMNMLELPKTIKILEALSVAGSVKTSKAPTIGHLDFRLKELQEITDINAKNEEQRKKLKEAAEKIGVFFGERIKTLYKRFGADINKQLAGISIAM